MSMPQGIIYQIIPSSSAFLHDDIIRSLIEQVWAQGQQDSYVLTIPDLRDSACNAHPQRLSDSYNRA